MKIDIRQENVKLCRIIYIAVIGGVDSMNDKDSYTIDVKKAAELLGVSQRTIYRYIKKGELKAIKKPFGYTEKWYIHKDQVQEKAKVNKEIVEVKEVNKPISKEEILKAMQQVATGTDQEEISELKQEIQKLNYKFDRVLTALQEIYLLQLKEK